MSRYLVALVMLIAPAHASNLETVTADIRSILGGGKRDSGISVDVGGKNGVSVGVGRDGVNVDVGRGSGRDSGGSGLGVGVGIGKGGVSVDVDVNPSPERSQPQQPPSETPRSILERGPSEIGARVGRLSSSDRARLMASCQTVLAERARADPVFVAICDIVRTLGLRSP